MKVGVSENAFEDLPVLDTAHMLRMTDDTGILQHAIFTIPNSSEGYTTDDNARALIVSTLLDKAHPGWAAGMRRLESAAYRGARASC